MAPPIFPPSWAEGLPAFWVPLVAGLLRWATRPLFWFCGGTPPTTPRQGASPPGPLVFPPSWAEGLPASWGVNLSPGRELHQIFPLPSQGRGVKGLGQKGSSPKLPGRGRSPLHLRFSYGRRRPTFFKEADFSRRKGHTPHAPRHGGFAPLDPPFAHPRGLWVRQRFGVLTSPPAENSTKFSPFPRREGGSRG